MAKTNLKRATSQAINLLYDANVNVITIENIAKMNSTELTALGIKLVAAASGLFLVRDMKIAGFKL